MKISVIIPIYNVEKYLNECVDSVLRQDYNDFEVVLVNDGSPDRCPEICDEYAVKDNRVVVVHKENGGLSDARNAGIKAASGDYLCFLDSDDFWDDPSALSKLAACIAENNSDTCQYFHRIYKEKENILKPFPFRNLKPMNGMETAALLKKAVMTNNLHISACSNAISRKFIIDNDLFFKKGIKTEDLEWAIRMYLCRPKISFIDDVFYIYRSDRDDSITSTVDYKHLCDYCWILETSLERTENGDEDLKESLNSYLMYHLLITCALAYKVKLSRKQRKEILSRLKKLCKGRITVYTLNSKVNLAQKIYKIAGFSVMAKAVGFYLKNRKK